MLRRPPRSTRTYTLFPYTTLFRSAVSKVPRCPRAPLSILTSLDLVLSPPLHMCLFGPVHVSPRHGGRVARIMEAIPLLGGSMVGILVRSEEHTSELQSLMRISYAVFCLKKKKTKASCNQQPT